MPPSPYMTQNGIDDFADEGVLDLDEEEMQLLWRKLATHAKRKRMRERDAATAWMNYYGGGPCGSFAASPGAGGMGMGGGSTGGNGSGHGGGVGNHYLKMAHSFSSPVERPELLARGASGATEGGARIKSAVAPGLPTATSLASLPASASATSGDAEDAVGQREEV